MDKHITDVEKAFELARSGKCLNITELIKRLKTERYDPSQIEGRVQEVVVGSSGNPGPAAEKWRGFFVIMLPIAAKI